MGSISLPLALMIVWSLSACCIPLVSKPGNTAEGCDNIAKQTVGRVGGSLFVR